MNSENQVPKARNISAQHGAEGGVLGQREKQPESPGGRHGSHADSSVMPDTKLPILQDEF
jgi:hypothetical protein